MGFENLTTVNVKIFHFFYVFEIDNTLTGHLWSCVHYTKLSFILGHNGQVVELHWDELLNVAFSVGSHTSSLSS